MRRRTVGAAALAACLALAACSGDPSGGDVTSSESTRTGPPEPGTPTTSSPAPTTTPSDGTTRPLAPPPDALADEARDLCARVIAGELGRQGDASVLAGSVDRVDVVAQCASTSTKGMEWLGGPPGEFQVQFAAAAVGALLDVLADRPRDARTTLDDGETCPEVMRPRTAYLVHLDGAWIVPDLLGEAGPCAMQYYPDAALVAASGFRSIDS